MARVVEHSDRRHLCKRLRCRPTRPLDCFASLRRKRKPKTILMPSRPASRKFRRGAPSDNQAETRTPKNSRQVVREMPLMEIDGEQNNGVCREPSCRQRRLNGVGAGHLARTTSSWEQVYPPPDPNPKHKRTHGRYRQKNTSPGQGESRLRTSVEFGAQSQEEHAADGGQGPPLQLGFDPTLKI